jgi:hypothetical protein
MDEDHPAMLSRDVAHDLFALRHFVESRDAHAAIAVLPVMERTAQTIAGYVSAREIDTLMLAMRGKRVHDAIVAAAKKNDGTIAEVEAQDLSRA